MTSKQTGTVAAAADSNSQEDSPTPAKRSYTTADGAATNSASGTNVRWSDRIPHNQRYTDEEVQCNKLTLTIPDTLPQWHFLYVCVKCGTSYCCAVEKYICRKQHECKVCATGRAFRTQKPPHFCSSSCYTMTHSNDVHMEEVSDDDDSYTYM